MTDILERLRDHLSVIDAYPSQTRAAEMGGVVQSIRMAADEIERLRAMWQPAPRGGMTSDWQYWSLVYQRRLRKLKKLIAAQGYDILSDEDGMPTALERKP